MNSTDRKRLRDFRAICRPCKRILVDPVDEVDETTEDPPSTVVSDPPNTDPPNTTVTQSDPDPTDPNKIDSGDRFDDKFVDPNDVPTPPPTTFVEDPKLTLTEQFPFPQQTPGPTFLGDTPQPPTVTTPPIIVPPPPDDPDPTTQPPNPPPTTACPSFHPTHTSVPGGKSQSQQVQDQTNFVNSKGFRHDPDGIPWIPRSSWVPWDGVTTINPCTSTKAQLMAFIFPPPGGVNTMRGIRERFYEVNPYADNRNPTVAEIENWNIEMIRHFRKLLGFNQTTHPVSNHKCTYLRAAWSEERARSNYWSGAYPTGVLDGNTGPCTVPFSSNAHCGGGFILNPSDQTPYLCPANMAACTATGGAEGVANVNSDIPWVIKLQRIMGQWLNSDGIGSHTGPFIGREYFGSAWYMNGGNTTFRGKWSGTLNPTCP